MSTAPKTEKASALAELPRSPGLPLLLTASALAIGLAALMSLVQSSNATSINGNVQRLEQAKADWQARLRETELEVASLSSLDRIEREAMERLGMVPPEEVRYITVPMPAPEPVMLPSRLLPVETEQEEPGSSLWDKLFGWFPLP